MRALFIATAMLTVGCGSGDGAQRTHSATASAAASAPAFAVAGAPEHVVSTKSLVMWLHISKSHVFYLDTVDQASGLEALVRVGVDGKTAPEEVARGKFTRLRSAGEQLILFDRDDGAQLVHEATKALQPLGPTAEATFRDGVVYVARPAGEGADVIVEAVPVADPTKPRRVAVIARGGKLSGSPSAMVATASDLYMAIDEEGGNGIRTPCHVFRVPIAGGDAKDVATVTDLHDLNEVGGKVVVGSLAKAHVLEPNNALTPIPDTYWDVLATDGKVAYFAIATSMPQGGIGGWLHVWAPPAHDQRIYEELRNPNALGLGDTHVYWFDGTKNEILRLARVDR